MWPCIINIGEEQHQLDATSTDVYSQLVNSQHVSGIIMPIVRRTDCMKLRVMFAWLCWLRSCGAGTRAVHTVWKLVTDCIKLHVVFAWSCWLQSCGAGTQAVHAVWKLVYQLSHSAHTLCPSSMWLQPTRPGKHHMQFYTVFSWRWA